MPAKLSDTLAIIAVLLSAISLYVSYRNYRRDTSRLKIGLRFGPDPVRGNCYMVRITNVGRRPASITHVYARLATGKRYPVMEGTRRLEEAEYTEVAVPMSGFRDGPASAIRAFEVEDSSDKVYKASTWRQWWHIPGARRASEIPR